MFLDLFDIEGFSKAEYMMVLIAILFGYITSEYFRGFGILFRNRKEINFPIRFILFTLITFFILTIHWWNMWDRSHEAENNFFSFFVILFYPLIFYMVSSLLLRKLTRKDLKDLDDYFLRKKTFLFSALGTYFLYDQLVGFYQEDLLFTIAGLILCVSGIVIRNRNFIKFILYVGSIIVLIYITISVIYPKVPPDYPINQLSYTKVEHLTIFISFIYAFVVAVYLKGWSLLVKDWESLKYSWGHLIWTFFSFFILISVWWNSWVRSGYMVDHFINFQISILPPLFLYMISLVLFPDKKQAKFIDLREYFEINRKSFFQLFLLYFLLNTGFSLMFREITFIGFTVPFRLIAIVVTAVAIFVNNSMFHKILPYLAFSIFIFYLIMNN